MNIHFLIYCECGEFWWSNVNFIPRVGDKVYNRIRQEFKVREVQWIDENNVNITLDRI